MLKKMMNVIKRLGFIFFPAIDSMRGYDVVKGEGGAAVLRPDATEKQWPSHVSVSSTSDHRYLVSISGSGMFTAFYRIYPNEKPDGTGNGEWFLNSRNRQSKDQILWAKNKRGSLTEKSLIFEIPEDKIKKCLIVFISEEPDCLKYFYIAPNDFR